MYPGNDGITPCGVLKMLVEDERKGGGASYGVSEWARATMILWPRELSWLGWRWKGGGGLTEMKG